MLKKLILGAALIFCAPLSACSNSQNAQAEVINNVKDIDAAQANQIISQNPNIKIIDIRTPDEFSSGHVANAINIDFYSANYAANIKSLPKDNAYIIYCRSGNRSGKSMNLFRNNGFKEVYNVEGGINHWQKIGLPN